MEEGDAYPDLFYRFRIPGIFIVKTVTKIISTHPGGQKPAVSPWTNRGVRKMTAYISLDL